MLEHPFLEAAREAAFERRDLDGCRTTRARVVVFLEEEQINFARGAAQRGLLQQQRKSARLLEVGRQQHVAEALGLAEVVSKISEEFFSIAPELMLDFCAVDVGAPIARLGRDAEIDRGFLQAVGCHLAGRDVEELDQQVGVGHGPAGHVAAGKVDPALGHLHAAVAKLGVEPEAAPRARHLVALAALAQVIEVEFEDVVSLDHIGVDLAQQIVERDQQALLAVVGFVAQSQQLLPVAALQADGENAITRSARVAETSSDLCSRLDVELTPAHVRKVQALEKSPAALQQPLALVRFQHVDRSTVAHALEKPLEDRERFGVRQPLENPRAFQGLDGNAFVFDRRIEPRERPQPFCSLDAPALRGGDREMNPSSSIYPETAEGFAHAKRGRLRTRAGNTP